MLKRSSTLMPEFKTTYDVEPHAELQGFDG